MNANDILTITSAICPCREAVIFEDNRISFAQLTERANQLSNALSALGVKKGDKIGMLEVNCNHCVEVYFATVKLGAIYVPINFRAKEDELTYIINFSEVNTLFIGERYIDLIRTIQNQLPLVKNFVSHLIRILCFIASWEDGAVQYLQIKIY